MCIRDSCCICYHPYSTLVCVLFGTAIPTSFCNCYNCFLHFYNCRFLYSPLCITVSSSIVLHIKARHEYQLVVLADFLARTLHKRIFVYNDVWSSQILIPRNSITWQDEARLQHCWQWANWKLAMRAAECVIIPDIFNKKPNLMQLENTHACSDRRPPKG